VTAAARPRVVVLVRDGCHLCEQACTVVEQVCDELHVGWTTRDLDGLDEATRRQWTDYVPVVLIDDDVHDVLRVSAERLRAALS